MKLSKPILLIILLAIVFLVGCSQKNEEPAQEETTPVSLQEAALIARKHDMNIEEKKSPDPEGIQSMTASNETFYILYVVADNENLAQLMFDNFYRESDNIYGSYDKVVDKDQKKYYVVDGKEIKLALSRKGSTLSFALTKKELVDLERVLGEMNLK